MREHTEQGKTSQTSLALPIAVREDHDPFKLLTGINFGTLFAFLRWSDFHCPHCGAKFQRTYLPNEVRLGSGERTCASCGRIFDDGSREWANLSRSERIRYILPTPMMGFIGGFLVCAALAIFAAELLRASVNWVILAWMAGACAFFIICFSAMRLPQIRRSGRRGSASRVG